MFSHVKRYSLDSDEAFFLIWDPATVDDKKFNESNDYIITARQLFNESYIAVAEV